MINYLSNFIQIMENELFMSDDIVPIRVIDISGSQPVCHVIRNVCQPKKLF